MKKYKNPEWLEKTRILGIFASLRDAQSVGMAEAVLRKRGPIMSCVIWSRGSASWPGLLLLLVFVAIGGCRTVHPAAPSDRSPAFSGQRALSSARQLVELSSATPEEVPGNTGQVKAFRWIEEQLVVAGAELRSPQNSGSSIEPSDSGRSVFGVLPGRSQDVFLLAATCCTESAAASPEARASLESVSGAAVVLELARALQNRDRPFTIWLAVMPDPPDHGQVVRGGLAAALAREPLRLAVFFESLAWPTLQVLRDLHSQGVYREAFWESARALDLGAVFVQSAPFASPPGAHRLLLKEDFRPVVALVGEPGSPPETSQSEERRLDEFGQVVLDALDRIAARLRSIDEFRGEVPESTLPAERQE